MSFDGRYFGEGYDAVIGPGAHRILRFFKRFGESATLKIRVQGSRDSTTGQPDFTYQDLDVTVIDKKIIDGVTPGLMAGSDDQSKKMWCMRAAARFYRLFLHGQLWEITEDPELIWLRNVPQYYEFTCRRIRLYE